MTLLQAYLQSPKARRTLSKRPGDKGFSLIELVVVVAILAILAAVALPNFLGVSKDGQIAAAKNTLATAVKECAVKETRVNSATVGESEGTGVKTPVQAATASLNGYKISKADAVVTNLKGANASLDMAKGGKDFGHSCYELAAVNEGGAIPHFQIRFNTITGATTKECVVEKDTTYTGGCYAETAAGSGKPDTDTPVAAKAGTKGVW